MSHPVAFVLLEGPVAVNESALVEALRQRHPDLDWDVAGNSAIAKPEGGGLIRCGSHLATVMSKPAPLPYDEILWTRASNLWPNARDAAGRHRAHLVVSMMELNKNRVESARLTTAVTGGVVAITSGSRAVAWGPRAVTRPPQLWLDMSLRAFAPFPDYPSTLWVDIVPFQSDQNPGAVTIGLSLFANREIEFEVDGLDRATVNDRVASLASYLIEHGAVVKDRDTIGASSAERTQVHFRGSRFGSWPVFAVGSDRAFRIQLKTYSIIPAAFAKAHPLLTMLGKVSLFDASSPDNQVQLRPADHVSESRLESYDKGIHGLLSHILATDLYVTADEKARRALAGGDVETAKSALMPFVKDIKYIQTSLRDGLTQGKVFMFMPKSS
jgi:uncharacterized protein DUF4261